MTKIEVFDPALCCSTGVCGPSPDQQLVAFAGVAKALENKAAIQRYNLAQEPTAFSENPIIKQILADEGTDALPVVLIDGKVVMKGVYPSKERLEHWLGLHADKGGCSEEETADEGCCSTEEASASSC